MNFFDPGQVQPPAIPLVGEGSVREPVANNDLALAERWKDDLAEMLNPGRSVQIKLGHRLYPDTSRRKQDLPEPLPYLCPTGFTGKQERSMDTLQERCQEANLGGFAAPFDSFEGNEKVQISPAPSLKNYTLNGIF